MLPIQCLFYGVPKEFYDIGESKQGLMGQGHLSNFSAVYRPIRKFFDLGCLGMFPVYKSNGKLQTVSRRRRYLSTVILIGSRENVLDPRVKGVFPMYGFPPAHGVPTICFSKEGYQNKESIGTVPMRWRSLPAKDTFQRTLPLVCPGGGKAS